MTLQEAILAGKKRYISGKPCPKGHNGERYVSSNSCTKCVLETSNKWALDNRERCSKRKARWYENNEAKQTNTELQRKYKITLDDYNAMFRSQGGVCAICLRAPLKKKRLNVDHCHITGTVRGLLCISCNSAIGGFMDDPKMLERAILYLRASL